MPAVLASEVPIAETADHVPFPGVNRAAANQTNRMVKIARPDCPECKEAYNPKGKNPGWWKICIANGHNPYVRWRERTAVEKKYETREDGARVLAGTEEVIYLDLILNFGQITVNETSNSGRGLERAVVFRGAKPLEELGYGLRCEMAGCTVPAKFACQYGVYCSDKHARLVGFDEDVQVHEVYDAKIAAKQMSQIQIMRREIAQPKKKKKAKVDANA